MADVNGVRVTPVKNPTIPQRMRMFALAPIRPDRLEIQAPIAAPAAREGAKMPPAPPVTNDRIGPAILHNTVSQVMDFSFVNKTVCIRFLPEPRIEGEMNWATVAMNQPIKIRKTKFLTGVLIV